MPDYRNSLQQFEDFIDTSIQESIEDRQQEPEDATADTDVGSDQRDSVGDPGSI